MSEQWFMYLVWAGLLIFSLYNIWKIIRINQLRAASQAWSAAEGQVLSKRVAVHTTSKGRKSYEAVIRYTYTVMGEQHEKEIARGSLWGKRSAEKAVEEIGDTIEVRYNPEKPEQHVTDQDRVRSENIFSAAWPLIMMAVLLYVFFVRY